MIRAIPAEEGPRLAKATKLLFLLFPTRISSPWERFLRGHTIGDTGRLMAATSAVGKAFAWHSEHLLDRANPRDPEYMTALAVEFRDRYAPQAQADLLIHNKWEARAADVGSSLGGSVIAISDGDRRSFDAAIVRGTYDATVLLYPDAVGLGWERIERRLVRAGVAPLMVLNGRRRAFVLDRPARRALIARRWIALSAVGDVTLVVVLAVSGLVLGLADLLRDRQSLVGKR